MHSYSPYHRGFVKRKGTASRVVNTQPWVISCFTCLLPSCIKSKQRHKRLEGLNPHEPLRGRVERRLMFVYRGYEIHRPKNVLIVEEAPADGANLTAGIR